MINHCIDINTITKAEISNLISLAASLKQAKRIGAIPKLLDGMTLGMIFELPSSRTRISFEVAMHLLGGHALYLKPGEIHLGAKEKLQDTARVLSKYCDGLIMRAWDHESIKTLSEYSDVPVINGLSDYNHPTQVLADLFTISEHTDKPLEEINLTFIGDRTNVCNSLLNACVKMNMNFKHIGPKKYLLRRKNIDDVIKQNPDYNKVIKTSTKITTLKGTEFLYTDLWWWVNQEDEKELRKEIFCKKYQVNKELIQETKNPDTYIMHCLPANRSLEITSEVLDSDQSLAFIQAENRLYMEMAILLTYLYSKKKNPSQLMKLKTREEILHRMKK